MHQFFRTRNAQFLGPNTNLVQLLLYWLKRNEKKQHPLIIDYLRYQQPVLSSFFNKCDEQSSLYFMHFMKTRVFGVYRENFYQTFYDGSIICVVRNMFRSLLNTATNVARTSTYSRVISINFPAPFSLLFRTYKVFLDSKKYFCIIHYCRCNIGQLILYLCN